MAFLYFLDSMEFIGFLQVVKYSWDKSSLPNLLHSWDNIINATLWISQKKPLTFYPFQLPGLVPVLSICNLQYRGIFLQNGENNFVYIRFQINVHTLNFLKFCHKLKRKKKEKQMRFKNFIHFQHPQKFLNLHLHAVMNFKILGAMKTIIKRYMYKNDKKINLIL